MSQVSGPDFLDPMASCDPGIARTAEKQKNRNFECEGDTAPRLQWVIKHVNWHCLFTTSYTTLTGSAVEQHALSHLRILKLIIDNDSTAIINLCTKLEGLRQFENMG